MAIGASATQSVTLSGQSASTSQADTLAVDDLGDDLAVDPLDSLEVRPGLSFVGKTAAEVG
jgi:hypothetical protein